MAITEVFPSPTVKQVIFQVKFQSLFYIENKIGDLQLAVMDRFPASKLIVHRGFLIGHVPVGQKLEQVLEDSQSTAVRKVWQFQTNDGVTLAISADSLSLTSDSHKTYNNKDSSHRFRDVIAFALSAFRSVIPISLFTRVGLRYIDSCPIPEKTTKAIKTLYRLGFPLRRFPLETVNEYHLNILVERGMHQIRYQEILKAEDGTHHLYLDFDAFSEDIRADHAMAITDELHDLSIKEYEKTITEQLMILMRKPAEVSGA